MSRQELTGIDALIQRLIDIASTVIRALIANRTAAPAIEELEAAVSII